MLKRILLGTFALALVGGAVTLSDDASAAPRHRIRTHMVCHRVPHRVHIGRRTIVRYTRVCHRERY